MNDSADLKDKINCGTSGKVEVLQPQDQNAILSSRTEAWLHFHF